MTPSACQGCGTPLPPLSAPGRPRKWCSERCRKNQYDLKCVDCGARVNGTTPSSRKGREPRCAPCRGRELGAERIIWTRDVIIAAIKRWNDLYGEPPAMPDWDPWTARRLNDEARAQRFYSDHWPPHKIVVQRFGNWNAAIAAAGFTPRPQYGVKENNARQRRFKR